MPAADLECHGRRRETGPHIGLPQMLERGVVKRPRQCRPAMRETRARRQLPNPGIVRVGEVQALLDLQGDGIDGGQVPLVAAVHPVAMI